MLIVFGALGYTPATTESSVALKNLVHRQHRKQRHQSQHHQSQGDDSGNEGSESDGEEMKRKNDGEQVNNSDLEDITGAQSTSQANFSRKSVDNFAFTSMDSNISLPLLSSSSLATVLTQFAVENELCHRRFLFYSFLYDNMLYFMYINNIYIMLHVYILDMYII